MTHGQIARICHEANRAYCAILGDDSQPAWANAPDWQKNSAMAGVLSIAGDPNRTPEQSHEGWFAQKIEEGWVFGDVKDPEKKTHPCMVPYSKLPSEQQVKDKLFTSIAKALI